MYRQDNPQYNSGNDTDRRQSLQHQRSSFPSQPMDGEGSAMSGQYGQDQGYNRNMNMMDDVTTLHDEEDPVERVMDQRGGDDYMDDGNAKYNEKYRHERNAINDAQSVAFTAYTMNLESGQSIVNDLRNVGVTVLSLESLSTAAMIHYMDAVTTMRLGNENDEKCMLYTDRMGRVFNVVIAGGAEGLSQTWSNLQSSFSGWLATVAIPFTFRVAASYSFDKDTDNQIALPPLALLFLFGFILKNETSQSWLAMSVLVRGTNSVGSHVWRTHSLVDQPRVVLMSVLILAGIAPASHRAGEALTLVGAILGCLILLCNLGSRAWKKLEIGYLDSTNVFSSTLVIIASIFAGLTFPYIALRSVHGGTDENDGAAAIEKIIFNPNGKRARQNVTLAATMVAIVFLFSDVMKVQNELGFDFSTNRGIVNLTVGIWWFLSTLASMSICHRLDSSRSKKIEPFLKKDETSPVGFIVPSVPNIVIDPSLSCGKMLLPFLSYGSDLLCAIVVTALATLIAYVGLRQIQGHQVDAFWEF